MNATYSTLVDNCGVFYVMTKKSIEMRTHRYGHIWKAVFTRDKNCNLCHSDKDLCIDHIVSVSKGGKSIMKNMRVLCRTCNVLEGHRNRELDPKLEKRRLRQREWANKHKGYFTKKSREFRINHPHYYLESNEQRRQLYRQSQVL